MGGKKNRQNKRLVEHLHDWVSMFQESDRACPLIAAELIDERLEELLRTVFLSNGLNEELQDRLLSSYSSTLSSLGAKTSICRAFGVLPQDTCDLIDAVREIRNYCGHHTRVANLADTDITKWVRKLQLFVQKEKAYKRLPKPRKAIENGTNLLLGCIGESARTIRAPASPSTP